MQLLTEDEKETLEKLFVFFEKDYGNLEELAASYLMIVDDFQDETKYFLEHGRYRNSSYEEVAQQVYYNEIHMEQYMIGLVLPDYIWSNHVKITRWFKEHLESVKGNKYLEIGPGFGHYFLMAVNHTDFEIYRAVDILQKSVEGATKYVESFCNDTNKKWSIECRDFLEYDADEKYDCIVMGEVLEHVEQPEKFMNKIFQLLNVGRICFVSTVINAPAVNHIWLFSSVEEIVNIITNAGLNVEEYFCTTENDVPLEKALRRKRAITIILQLTK